LLLHVKEAQSFQVLRWVKIVGDTTLRQRKKQRKQNS